MYVKIQLVYAGGLFKIPIARSFLTMKGVAVNVIPSRTGAKTL